MSKSDEKKDPNPLASVAGFGVTFGCAETVGCDGTVGLGASLAPMLAAAPAA